MDTKVGLWIDHRNAVIMHLTDRGDEMALIISNVDKQRRRSGDSSPDGAHVSGQAPADDRRQGAFSGHLNIYYEAVVANIRDADSILIFGPGEAKGELRQRLQRNRLDARIVGLESADKMTDPQIAAKVRRHFPK